MGFIATLIWILNALLSVSIVINYVLKQELSLKITLALGITLTFSFTYQNIEKSFNENFKKSFNNNSLTYKLFSGWSISDWSFLKNMRFFSNDKTVNQYNDSLSMSSSSDRSQQSVDASTTQNASVKQNVNASINGDGTQGRQSSPSVDSGNAELANRSTPPQVISTGRVTPVASASTGESIASSRFFAIRTGSQGKGVKVRLYDSRSKDWLDGETHILSKEPSEGSAVQVGGVQAVYKKKR